MKRQNKNSIKHSSKKILILFRLFIGATAISLLLFISFRSIDNSSETVVDVKAYSGVLGASDYSGDDGLIMVSPNNIKFSLKEPCAEEIETANLKYQEKLRRIEEERIRQEEEKRRQKQIKVDTLANFLKKRGSPMASYAESIINVCEKYGYEFCKVHLSIAAVESGLGRIPIGCCNAWGMVGKYYPSWEVSIPQAADWFACNYYNKGVDTFEELAYSSYGPLNPEKWISDLYSFYNQIPF